MKRTKATLILAALIVGIGIVLLCSSFLKKMSRMEFAPGAGLNGSFEQVKNGLPVNWYVYTPQTVKGSDFDISFDQQHPKDGKQSLLFSVRKCGAIGGWRSPGFAREIAAKPGDLFKVALWVKNSSSKFRVKVVAVNATQSAAAQTTNITEDIHDWRKMEYTYTIPKGMNKLRIEVNVLSPGAFWVDNVSVVKGVR
jgi:hypothetical protein